MEKKNKKQKKQKKQKVANTGTIIQTHLCSQQMHLVVQPLAFLFTGGQAVFQLPRLQRGHVGEVLHGHHRAGQTLAMRGAHQIHRRGWHQLRQRSRRIVGTVPVFQPTATAATAS